jgi:hypothetical protein
MGPLVFLTPLAIITWALDNNNQPVASVHDCRHRFRPLCETSCCCTITVGDGQTSFGDVASVQTAIELAPDGGEVCVLQGTYRETVTIDGRHNITIVGCGPNSLLMPGRECGRGGADDPQLERHRAARARLRGTRNTCDRDRRK